MPTTYSIVPKTLRLCFIILFFLVTQSVSAQLLPPLEKLSPYWKKYFHDVDNAIAENFWGSLTAFKETAWYKDPYLPQLKEMGYNYETGHEHPARYYESISWVLSSIDKLVENGTLSQNDVLLPAKVFVSDTESTKPQYHFIRIGSDIPKGAKALNLLTPDLFVQMLSMGYFPIGEAIRESTNQTLAEHDLAHMAGFISSPQFMKATREAFRRVGSKMKTNPRVAEALKNFDSLYSLRLYYMIEVFSEIPKKHHAQLQKLIELPITEPPSMERISKFLHEKAKDPAELNRYLANIYLSFHELVNPVGGESRDVLNRRRKFSRGSTLGSFYDHVSTQTSKFDQSSIYALYLNAKAALENKRSNHKDYYRAIDEIHAPLIGALIGTSQLNIEDWVLQAVEEVPDPNSKLYRYLHDSHLWNHKHILYVVYTDPEYDRVLSDS